ncbi:nodulation protein NoeA [Flavobacterium alvei]|uniref:Nodulation protein NoeA n=1 Tax=Flavobacterium alvei TaxID=2080416 RepID=A0A2S5AG45_9FLAO|nr:nodulation protein NoeA [Flavobacterium alvei]POY41103.1 nodulation protein NoeA [Flavobacterium alvei]HQE34033.1 class I SAM-dependent methyltransferase [Flavobacterium alvei]HQK38815.1 class I SAM-dependent methyltransferase [Flavobacterium alvei]
MESKRNTSSFRDPSGYVFIEDDSVKRVVNHIYFEQYNQLTSSGFYQLLFDKKYLVSHQEVSRTDSEIIIEASKIPFINYPYEWSFLQYKHAALLTLKIQKLCLENNFTLKDASAFNITFHEGKPIFIDTLSFDFYQENNPWLAYKQFVMHFLGPLVLTKYFGQDHLKTLALHLEGISLQKLSNLLPLKSYWSPILLTNIHLLAKYDKKYESDKKKVNNNLSKASQIKLLDGLYDYILNLSVNEKTEWDHYYNQINYNEVAYQVKKEFVKDWFSSIKGKSLIDIGGNDGTFSRELKELADFMIVADVDANAVEQNYKQILKNKEKSILPIVVDVLNPVANYGFNNQERFSFIDRVEEANLDAGLALAVIHHITLSGNIPFSLSAQFFSKMAPNLLIEFPTRADSWVQFLLDSKREFKSHFDFYNEENFENEYAVYFEIVHKVKIDSSERILYSLKRR